MSIARKLNSVLRLLRYRRAVRRFLEFYESSEAAFVGSVQPNELGFLEELVTRSNSLPGEIIEVGTLFGFTTQHIAKWKRADKALTTIDDFRSESNRHAGVRSPDLHHENPLLSYGESERQDFRRAENRLLQPFCGGKTGDDLHRRRPFLRGSHGGHPLV